MLKVNGEILALTDLSEQDKKNFIEWGWLMREKNQLDLRDLQSPRLAMCKASVGDDPLMYVPIKPVLLYGSLALRPNLTNRQIASGLWRMVEATDKMMLPAAQGGTDIDETYLFTQDNEYAEKCINHGFEEVKGVRVLRRRAPTPSTEGQ